MKLKSGVGFSSFYLLLDVGKQYLIKRSTKK